MNQRLDIVSTNADGIAAVSDLDAYGIKHVPAGLLLLIQLRASRLNGCAYCIDLHTRQLRRHGESEARITALGEPELDVTLFDARELAALRLTDAETRLAPGGVPDDVWADAADQFSEVELGNLVIAITTINTWNRIAITTRMKPEGA